MPPLTKQKGQLATEAEEAKQQKEQSKSE